MDHAIIDVLVERLNGLVPRTAIVLGSGLGALVDEVTDPIRIPYGIFQAFRKVLSPAMQVSWSRVILVASRSSCCQDAFIIMKRAMHPPCARQSRRWPVSVSNP